MNKRKQLKNWNKPAKKKTPEMSLVMLRKLITTEQLKMTFGDAVIFGTCYFEISPDWVEDFWRKIDIKDILA